MLLVAFAFVALHFSAKLVGAVAPTLSSLSPTSGSVGTSVTVTGANFVTDLLVGKVGWWGPFHAGIAPNNLVIGRPNATVVGAPAFTLDGGGAVVATDSAYLDVADGGSGVVARGIHNHYKPVIEQHNQHACARCEKMESIPLAIDGVSAEDRPRMEQFFKGGPLYCVNCFPEVPSCDDCGWHIPHEEAADHMRKVHTHR